MKSDTSNAQQNSMKVIELVVENYMGVRAVEIRPTGNIVRIEGKNGAGKSSVIDAIWVAIGGTGESGNHPLRNGTKKGRSYVDLGDIRVERKFTEAGTYLEVADKDGKKIPRPQEFLDQFYSKTTIDPRNFIQMRPTERRDLLLDLTGKRDEIEELDEQRESMYGERTLVNRELKTLQGKLAGRGVPAPDAGVEIPIAGLLKELEGSIAADALHSKNVAAVVDYTHRVARLDDAVDHKRKQIAALEEEIETLVEETTRMADRLAAAEEQVDLAPYSETARIRERISAAEHTNERVRKNAEVVELGSKLTACEVAARNLTEAIEGIDERKTEILGESALSIGQVGFDGDTLLVGGVPFDDLSTSEQLRVSLEIAVSQNPRIRVVRVSDGNVFDDDSMGEIEAWADDHDCQLWIERVADAPDGMGFFIKDGSVVEE